MAVAPQIVFNAPPDRREQILQWRKRSRVIAALRIALPATIGLILLGLAGSVAYNTLSAAPVQPKDTSGPIRLVNPRFVGRDDKGRAFVITARTATRDPKDYQRVLLEEPALVMDQTGPDPVRIVARQGIYYEGAYKLDLHGGVRLLGSKAAFDTAASMFDTKSGEVVGSGPIQGSGSLGEIQAKSYSITDKGQHMVFRGGVHTRFEHK